MTPLRTSVAAIACLVLFAVALALEVRIEPPRVRLSWKDGALDSEAVARERGLVDARPVEGAADPHTFAYRPLDASPTVNVRWRRPAEWRDALQRQSAAAFVFGLVVLWCSTATALVRRIGVIAACIGLVVFAWTEPLDQQIRMGDSGTYTASRESFERYFASASEVRFEAHLSALLLRTIDRALGSGDRAPAESFRLLGRLATGWFAAMLVVAAWAGGWSPSALRYVAVAGALPSALLFCGYRELGHLALNPAVIPLTAAGLRGRRGRLVLASLLAGLGAALHGFGVLSLAGIACAIAVARTRVVQRVRLLATSAAVGATAYLGWVIVYVAVMHLTVTPGHAASLPLRPILRPALAEHRVNEAMFSLLGAREVTVAAWIAGLPLLLPALAAITKLRFRAAPMVMYAVPSAAFLVVFWPIQGLAVEADLLVAAFPGAYALAWIASRWRRATWYALVIAASAHVVFWRTVLGDVFVNARVY